MNYKIETENLSKKHREVYRVRDIALRVPQGCVYGFLGPNGAGKTTTLKLLLGLIRPDSGRILYSGQPMTEKNKLALLKTTGSLIENPSFYGHLTGYENLEIIARMKQVESREIEAVLETVRLTENANKRVKLYSLGMKQRLGLAMALLGTPEILILDEPTNGLDPAGIQEIRNLIRSLPERFGMTVIVSSHLLNEVEQMADYVGIIDHGQLLFQGTLAELDPQGNRLEQIFLEMTNRTGSL